MGQLDVLFIGDTSSPLTEKRVQLCRETVSRSTVFRKGRSANGLFSIPIVSLILRPVVLLGILFFQRPKVVHVFWAYQGLDTFVLLFSKSLVVTVMGGDIEEDQSYRGFRTVLINILLRKAKTITAKSQYMIDKLKRIEGLTDDIRWLNWGINLDAYTSFSLKRSSSIFFSLRACDPLYNHHLVIDAFAKSKKNHPDIQLWITTFNKDDQYLTRLKKQTDLLGLTNSVEFLDPLSPEAMATTLSKVLATIQVPISDGMPHSLYESMAAGCLPILNQLPQYHELIEHKKNGYFCDPNHIEQMTKAFDWALDNRDNDRLKQNNREQIMAMADSEKEKEKIKALYT